MPYNRSVLINATSNGKRRIDPGAEKTAHQTSILLGSSSNQISSILSKPSAVVNSTSNQHQRTHSIGSEYSRSLNLMHEWDQECGDLSYSASFACYDKHFQDYYQFKRSSLWNAKYYFNSLIDTNPTHITEPCRSFESFLNRHYSQLTKNCSDIHQYSHCQVYSLIEFSPFNLTCSSWHRQPYIHKEYTGVTLLTQISLSRVDRIPYHLARWKELKVIVIMLEKKELKKAWKTLVAFREPSLRFILYVVDPQYTPYLIKRTNPWTVQYKSHPFYSFNLFRDIAIESITTTHFLMIDGDVFISTDTKKDIERQKSLSRFNTFLILPLFSPTLSVRQKCEFSSCISEWAKIPLIRSDLERAFKKGQVIGFNGCFHKYQDPYTWIKKHGVEATHVPIKYMMEPYGVFRRSALNTLYHPYYVDYGRDKIEFFHRLIAEKYQFYLLPEAFGYDIPHPQTNVSNEWRSQKKGERITDALWNSMCQENPAGFSCDLFFVYSIKLLLDCDDWN